MPVSYFIFSIRTDSPGIDIPYQISHKTRSLLFLYDVLESRDTSGSASNCNRFEKLQSACFVKYLIIYQAIVGEVVTMHMLHDGNVGGVLPGVEAYRTSVRDND